jgi:hypothetical protein
LKNPQNLKLGKTTIDGRPAEASRTAFITAFIRAFHSAKTGLDPKVLEEDLLSIGWELRQDLSAGDIEEMYFRGCAEGLSAGRHLHLALAAVRFLNRVG